MNNIADHTAEYDIDVSVVFIAGLPNEPKLFHFLHEPLI